jgi:hypothetical protein
MVLKLIGYLLAFSLIPCIHQVMRKHAILKNSAQFPGSVVGHVGRSGGRGGRVYALEVEYRNGNGTAKRFVTSSAGNPPARAVGDKVVVFEHRDGGAPDVLLFEELYVVYWLWFCCGIAAVGCLVAPALLRLIYLK